jgi:hypothetical protein
MVLTFEEKNKNKKYIKELEKKRFSFFFLLICRENNLLLKIFIFILSHKHVTYIVLDLFN